MSYSDMLLKYALPEAGDLVGGLIQAHAQGKASDAQSKALEQALAYQKESDAFNRARQTGLDAQEVQRYGDYQGRLAPWIANGTSSNDRMTALLDLPARAASSSPAGGGYSSGPRAVPTSGPDSPGAGDPAVAAFIADWQQTHAPSEGIAPLAAAIAQKFPQVSRYQYGQTPSNNELSIGGSKYKVLGGEGTPAAYWYQPGTDDSPGARTYATVAPTAVAPAPAGSQSIPVGGSVSLRAPDGSLKSVPADQVDHYTALGATRVPAPAPAPPAAAVQMRAPDGSTKLVSADQVDHYTKLGATLLQGAA